MDTGFWVVALKSEECRALARLKPDVLAQVEAGSAVLVHARSPVYARGIGAALRGLPLPPPREELEKLGISMRERKILGSKDMVPVYESAVMLLPHAGSPA